jgi:hypothetical protein
MFAIAQAGSSLQVIKTDGTVQTLTLPAGVTIDPTVRGMFAVLARQILFSCAGSINLWIDPFDFTVRPMSIQAPLSAPTVAAGSGAGLTGAYSTAVSFGVKDQAGTLVNQSPLSPTSAPLTVANKDLVLTLIPISTDTNVNCRILYRTAANGTVLFQWLVLDDNTTTTIDDAMPDKSLSLLPSSPSLGVPPGAIPGTFFQWIVQWKDRLWAVSTAADERDDALFTEAGQFYAWAAENSLPAYPKGEDAFGIVGGAARRDALGLLKRNRVLKVIGSSPADFQVVIVAENAGCIARDSVVVIRDVAYWLGVDGVYRWDDNGVICLSRSKVDPWFTTDTFFNKARFQFAFAGWDPLNNTYDLSLAAAGSSVEDRVVKYAIDQDEWLGPDSTSAFTPTARALLYDADDNLLPSIGGSDGYVYLKNQSTPTDVSGAAVSHAIHSKLSTKWLSGNAPDITHYWGQLSVLFRKESGGTLTITPYLGDSPDNGTSGTPFSVDLTSVGRLRLDRIGVGALTRLLYETNTAGVGWLLYGYEINPVFEVGRR